MKNRLLKVQLFRANLFFFFFSSPTIPRRLRLGVGAVCSTQIRFLHPARIINEAIPNRTKNQRLENLLTIRLAKKKVNRKEQKCIVFRHETLPNQELHCVKRWVQIDQEGATCNFFENPEPTEEETSEAENDGGGEEVPEFIRNLHVKDVQAVRDVGLAVDDDNNPALENVPTEENEADQSTYNWDWDG